MTGDRKARETRILLSVVAGAVIFFMIACLGCGGLWLFLVLDTERPLPNGYEIEYMKGYGWFIHQEDGGSGVVPSSSRPGDDMILDVAIVGDLVVGRADDATAGGMYFVLDTATGRLSEDLSRDEAVALLDAAGNDMPELVLPRRLPRR